MELNVVASERMSLEKEETKIRLTPYQLKKNSLSLGDKVILYAADKSKIILTVEQARSGESSIPGSGTFVTRNIIKRLFPFKDKHVVTLGCDPEFIILNKGSNTLVPANFILPHDGEIGSDGPLGEFRPKPGYNDLELITNLKILIKEFHQAKEILFAERNFVAEAHSCKFNQAMGFHIHIGAPITILTFAVPGSKEFIRKFVTALDYFVGIPSMLLEDDSTRRLGNGKYGKAGDYRLSNKTIEYRTPGGFNLRHPIYASGIIALAGCLADELFRDIEEESNGWRNLKHLIQSDFIKTKYNLPEEIIIKGALKEKEKALATFLLPKIIESITKMKSFGKYQNSLQKYLNLFRTEERYSYVLKDNW